MKCKECKGTGKVLDEEGEEIECPECDGTGEVEDEEEDDS